MKCHKCGHSIDEHRVNVKKIGCHHAPCECELRPSGIIDTLSARHARADELLRACNKTGGVVVELYKGRYLRDLITEYLNEVDGKEATK
jgi:Fe-S cluster assembly iron-binding protein IscA